MDGTFFPTPAPTVGNVTDTTGLPPSGMAAYDRLTGIVPPGFQPAVVASRSVPVAALVLIQLANVTLAVLVEPSA